MFIRKYAAVFLSFPVFLLSFALSAQAKEINQQVHFGDVTINEGETVSEIVVLFGDLTVEGKVEKDAVVVFGNLDLKQSGSIKNDAVVVGGNIKLVSPSQIAGDKVQVSLTGSTQGNFLNGLFKVTILGIVLKYLGILASKLIFLLTTILLAFIFAKNLMTMGETISSAPWKCGIVGLLLWICLPALMLLLIVSIVGILLLPLLVPLLFLVVIFSYAAMAALIGKQIKMKNATPAMQISLGALIIFLLSLIPLSIAFIFPVTLFIGTGAILFSSFGTKLPKFVSK